MSVALGLVAAGGASAAERMSDTAYLSAMRCRGLAEARQLDVSAIDSVLKGQKNGRATYIGDRGKQMRREAVQDGRSTDLTRKARIDAELNGACGGFFGPAALQTAQASGGAVDPANARR